MRKIPTIFERDPDHPKRVTANPHPDCAWVFAGEGVATRKYDGTCVMFDGEQWWARREVKSGKQTPPNYQPLSTDPHTGKTTGWEPIGQSAFAKQHAEAIAGKTFTSGTYELVGPKINGNPEQSDGHQLIAHAEALIIGDAPRTYAELAGYDFAAMEGLVFHHPDGRMAKIKARDFPR